MAKDPYWSNTTLLIHGTDGVVDASPAGTELSPNGSLVTPYTSDSKFGGACMRCDGVSRAFANYISTNFTFGSGDFTVEFWMKSSGTWASQPAYCGIVGISSATWCAYKDGTIPTKMNFRINDSNYPSISTPAADTWEHWAFVRSNGTLYVIKNGNVEVSYVNTASIPHDSNNRLVIGFTNSWGGYFRGLIQDIRITKGVARYPVNSQYVVPTGDISVGGYTVLLMHMNNGEGGSPTDAMGHIAPYNSVSCAATPTRWGEGSANFTGSVYIRHSSSDFIPWDAPFAIDAWVRIIDYTMYNVIVSMSHPTVAQPGNWFFGTLPTSGILEFDVEGVIVAQDSKALSVGVWHHVGVTRIGNWFYILVDGNIVGWGTSTKSLSDGNELRIGRGRQTSTNYFKGNMEKLRFEKGVSQFITATTPTTMLPTGGSAVSGKVYDHNGDFAERTIHVHSRATGRLLGVTTSNASTGEFSVPASEECYVVVLDSTGTRNSLVLDRLDPNL